MGYMCYVSVHLSHYCYYIRTPKRNRPNNNSSSTGQGRHTAATISGLKKNFKTVLTDPIVFLLSVPVVHLSCWPSKFTQRLKKQLCSYKFIGRIFGACTLSYMYFHACYLEQLLNYIVAKSSVAYQLQQTCPADYFLWLKHPYIINLSLFCSKMLLLFPLFLLRDRGLCAIS